MVDNRAQCVADDIACPKRCKAKPSNAENEAANGETLVPSGIGELLVVGIGNLAKKYLTHNTQDVDSRDNDCRTGDDGGRAVEYVVVLERTHEDGHLGNETRETRQALVGQTRNDITHAEERHYLHQSAQLTDVAGVSTAIDHTDKGKEKSRHQSV